MEDLRGWRDKWKEVAEFERTLHKPQPIMEKVTRYLSMCEAFAERLQATERNYRPDKVAALEELQRKLRRFGEYQLGRAARDTD